MSEYPRLLKKPGPIYLKVEDEQGEADAKKQGWVRSLDKTAVEHNAPAPTVGAFGDELDEVPTWEPEAASPSHDKTSAETPTKRGTWKRS